MTGVAVRVLSVVKGLGPGGAERLLCAQSRAHDASRVEMHCAYVLAWKDHLADELVRAGATVTCLSGRRRDPWWPVRLARLVRGGGWDVVHVHSPLPGAVARLAVRSVPAARRPRLVATEHNRWATHRWPTRLLSRLTSRFDDVTFAVTDEVRASLSGPVADRAVTLRHGIDVAAVAALPEERAACRAELGLGDDEIVVGTVANFRPQKDYPNLLAAAARLRDRGLPIRIVAVGQGPDEGAIRELHAELGLGDRVILTGFRDDAVRVMAACDAFTLASRWEGLPVALMEATALGLPIVATAVGGVAETFGDGTDAVLVPAADPDALAGALERVAADASFRAELAAGSRRRSSQFDVGAAVAAIERAYGVAPAPSEPGRERSPRFTRPRSGFDVRPATADDRHAILELCRASLGWGDDPRFEALFAWKHDHNVFGPSPMWVATDGGRVVAVRAFMRWEFVRGSGASVELVRAVRAVDTATHPEYRGRGLFTDLTLHGLDELRAAGVDVVFNTPNAQSRPGYLQMGWEVVGRLPVSIRPIGATGAATVPRARGAASHWPLVLPAGVGVPIGEVDGLGALVASHRLERVDDPLSVRRLRTSRSPAWFRWRYGWDELGYRAVPCGAGVAIVRLRSRGTGRELVLSSWLGCSPSEAARAAVEVAGEVGATHALRLSGPHPGSGWLPAPGGPVLTFRQVAPAAAPPLPNWHLDMGDIELL